MLHIHNLSFSYGKYTMLFDAMDLEMQQGAIVGLLGKNGAGKSTLLNLINGFIPPQKGNIDVLGFVPHLRKPTFLADTYMVPEEFDFPNVSIGTYVRAYSPFYKKFDHHKLDKIITGFDLNYRQSLNKMSHGQRKKFLIAFALSTNSRLLLLDEPTNGLDIPSKSQFRKMLVSSVADNQLVIISTHQVKDIDNIIDTVMVMDKGKIIFNNRFNHIAEQLRFETSLSLPNDADVLYYEKNPMGYKLIRQTNEENDTQIDLELLFNAITNQSIKIGEPTYE